MGKIAENYIYVILGIVMITLSIPTIIMVGILSNDLWYKLIAVYCYILLFVYVLGIPYKAFRKFLMVLLLCFFLFIGVSIFNDLL